MSFSRVGGFISLGRWLTLSLAMFATSCGQPPAPSTGTPSAGDWRTFEGTWSASGTRQTLNLEQDHRASIFDLTGSLLLIGDQAMGIGFQSHAMGFTDSLAGMQGRCVWTDEHGDKVYSELKGEFVAAGNRIVGTIQGGTGRYAGLTGEYSFQWRFVVESEDGAVSGRAVDLKGRARLGLPAAVPGVEPKK